jgi:hypothetical protein
MVQAREVPAREVKFSGYSTSVGGVTEPEKLSGGHGTRFRAKYFSNVREASRQGLKADRVGVNKRFADPRAEALTRGKSFDPAR